MHGWVIRTIAHVKPCERILKRCQKNLANGEPERQYRAKLINQIASKYSQIDTFITRI